VSSLAPQITGHPDDRTETPRSLREEAVNKCKAKAWAECLHSLDGAKKLDPEGDNAPEVVSLRAAAQAGLAEKGAR
jgi:hypothetical protein